MTDKEFNKLQEIENSTWSLTDPEARKEKIRREIARYPLMAKQMGLQGSRACIDTSDMVCYDIGCGPTQGLSSILNCKERVCIDPNKNLYSKYFNVSNYLDIKAEDLKKELSKPDLIISTNCIDHFKDPVGYLKDLVKYMKYGAFFVHFHGIDNASQHPHPAHKFNLNPEITKNILYNDFELVWYMNYKEDGLVYSWLKEKSFCEIWRRTTKPKV